MTYTLYNYVISLKFYKWANDDR